MASTHTSEIELQQTADNVNDTTHDHATDQEFTLAPADTGKDAWLFLAGAFMIEALVWGFPFSFGAFQSYYSKHPWFENSTGVAVIGTTCSGIMYLSAPIVFTFLDSFPKYRQIASMMGLACCVISLIGASFATTIGQLIATQGVLYAAGGSLLYSPAILYMDQWFVRRKGLAYGVMWAGTGVSGVVMPLVLTAALEQYGYETVHRASAVAVLVLSAPLLYFVKPRLPIPATATRRSLDASFLKSPFFLILQLANISQGLGFFLPTIYLPLHAESLSLSPATSTVLLSVLNLASVFGQIFLGALSDRIHISTVILISAIGTSIAVFTTWGLATTLAPLVVFSILYGFFAGGYTSTYAGCCRDIRGRFPSSTQGFVFGMFAAGRGIGNVVCGPLSEVLLQSAEGWSGKGAYGTKFGGLVVVTGVTAVGSAIGFASRRLKTD